MMTNDDAENLTKPNIRSVEDLADWPPETVKETAPDTSTSTRVGQDFF